MDDTTTNEKPIVEELLEDEGTEPETPAPPQPAHVMLDLETLGNGNNAVPISIGACRFTATEILDSFHVAIDPESCEQYGLKMDASTILWWFDPGRDEARQRWLSMQKVDLPSVLTGFSQWLQQSPVLAIWGNGSTFDNVILRSAYKAAGLEYPVKFWQDQCYRTIKNRTPQIGIVREGTHHDALDDAISQAKHLQEIMAQVNAPLTLLERMQRQAARYLEPSPQYSTFASDSSDVVEGELETQGQRDRAFINDMIYLLDGPEQREAMDLARTDL